MAASLLLHVPIAWSRTFACDVHNAALQHTTATVGSLFLPIERAHTVLHRAGVKQMFVFYIFSKDNNTAETGSLKH